MIFEIAMIVLAVYYFTKDPSHVKDWENYFIEKHGARGNQTVQLNIDSENTALLIMLCKKKVKEAELLTHPPRKETHFIAFRKNKHPPFRAEMIRCKKNFAIIDAPGHHCVYVLRKGKRNKHVPGEMFYIIGKFCYHPSPDMQHIEGESHNAARTIRRYANRKSYPNEFQSEYNFYTEPEYQAYGYQTYMPKPTQYAEREYQSYAERGYQPYQDRHKISNEDPQYERSQRPPEIESYVQDAKNPLNNHTHESSNNKQFQSSRKHMEPSLKIQDYKPSGYTENYLHSYDRNQPLNYSSFDNRNTLLHQNQHYLMSHNNRFLQPENRSLQKLDEPSRRMGHMEMTFPLTDHSQKPRSTDAETLYRKSQLPYQYPSYNNQPLPPNENYIEGGVSNRKYPLHSHSNPYNDQYRQRSSIQDGPGEYGEMNLDSIERSPHAQAHLNQTVQKPSSYENYNLSVPLKNQSFHEDDIHKPKFYGKNILYEYEADYENDHRHPHKTVSEQPLHLNNKDYSISKNQLSEQNGLNEVHKVESYIPRETNSAWKIPNKTEPICNTCDSEEIHLHHSAHEFRSNIGSLHDHQPLFEESNPPAVETTVCDGCKNEKSILQQSSHDDQSSPEKGEELHHQHLSNENVEFHNETILCDTCSNASHHLSHKNESFINEIPLPHNDEHMLQKTHPREKYKFNNKTNKTSQYHQFQENEHLTHVTSDKMRRPISEEINPKITVDEETSTCDECGSEQSYPLHINEYRPNSNYTSSRKNRTQKLIKNEFYNKLQPMQINQRRYGELKTHVEYPMYGSKSNQELASEDELKRLYYSGKILIPGEEPDSEIPSSYILSANQKQTAGKQAKHTKNKSADYNFLKDDVRVVSRLQSGTEMYSSRSRTYKEMDPHSYNRQSKNFRKLYAKPPVSSKTILNKTFKSNDVSTTSTVDFVDDDDDEEEEEEKTTMSSLDEFSSNDYAKVSKVNGYKNYNETKSIHTLPRYADNSSNKTLGKDGQSEQSENDYFGMAEEIESELSNKKLEQSHKDDEFGQNKNKRMHQPILNEKSMLSLNEDASTSTTEVDDFSHKSANVVGKNKASKMNDDKLYTSHNVSSSESQDEHNVTTSRSEHVLTVKKKPGAKYPQDEMKKPSIQSVTLDSPSSLKSQDNRMKSTRSRHFFTKIKEEETKRQSNQDNSDLSAESTAQEHPTSPESDDNYIRRTKAEHLETRNKETVNENETDQKSEEEAQSRASENFNSPESEKKYARTTRIRSDYLLTKN